MFHLNSYLLQDMDSRSNLILFTELCEGHYEGPEGHHLQDFIELNCPATASCHLGVLSNKVCLKHKKKVIAERNTPVKSGSYLNISESVQITKDGEDLIRLGFGSFLVIEYVLRCKGGFHNGVDRDSGSNCCKVAPIGYSSWCSTFGNEKCPDDCGFLDLIPKHDSGCPRFNLNFLGKCA